MRLIDADLFKEDMTHEFPEYYEEVLDAQPTIDAVLVIRCKNCRFFDSGICHAEDERAYDLSENHYCGFGEPKEEQ